MNPQIKLRIIVLDPPPNVTFALQRGRSDLVPAVAATRNALVFEFELIVADLDSDPPRFTGAFAQGPASKRFVYINSGSMAGEGASCWSRRAKIPLYGITRTPLKNVLTQEDLLLETVVSGRAKDGGPACATVPLLSPWTPKSSEAPIT